MPVTPLGSSLALKLTALGVTAVTVLLGCGQLWRPFLDPAGCAADNPCEDLGMIIDAGVDLAVVSEDGGASPWQVESSGTTQNLNGVWGVATTYTIEDGGVRPSQTVHTNLWAVGAGGTVLARASTDGTWVRQKSIMTNTTFQAVSGHGITDVWAVGDLQATALWNGASWIVSQPTDLGVPPGFLGIAAMDNTNYLAVGQNNVIIALNSASPGSRSVPAGYTASTQADQTSIHYNATSGISYIGLSIGDIIKHTGTSYGTFGLQLGAAVRAIWSRSAADVWAVGDKGVVVHYDGSNWAPVTIPTSAITGSLRGVTGSAKGELWLVGDAGTIVYYNGTTWTRQDDASGVTLRGVWFDAETGGTWIVGDRGLILHRGPATK